MKYLITGTPHSGTRYMALLFRAYGLDVNHEDMGEHGTSCWAWGAPDAHKVEAPWSPGLRPILHPDEWTVVHIYRDPLVCIPALADDTKPETLAFLSRFIPEADSLLHRAAMTYNVWNLLIRDIRPDHTINVEDAEAWAAQHLGRRWFPLPGTRTNTRARGKRQPLTWAQIEAEAPSELPLLRSMARERQYIVEAA